MNRFFEFSRAQVRTLIVLVVLIALVGGYRVVDRAVYGAEATRVWEITYPTPYSSTLSVDINRSPADSLELVPGIGSVLARRIVEYREAHGKFAAVDSLVLVPGIGPATVNRVRVFVKVSP